MTLTPPAPELDSTAAHMLACAQLANVDFIHHGQGADATRTVALQADAVGAVLELLDAVGIPKHAIMPGRKGAQAQLTIKGGEHVTALDAALMEGAEFNFHLEREQAHMPAPVGPPTEEQKLRFAQAAEVAAGVVQRIRDMSPEARAEYQRGYAPTGPRR